MERLTKNINGVICYVGEHKQNDEDVPAEMTPGAVRDVLTSLFAYEEAEEKGRLARIPPSTPDIDFTHLFELVMADAEKRVVVLPCKVGSTVFTIEENYFDCEECSHKDRASYQESIQRTACDMDGVHCPLTIEEHVVKGFNIGHGKTDNAEISAPGEWGYEGLETFYGFDGKWYLTREAAEAALQKTLDTPDGV